MKIRAANKVLKEKRNKFDKAFLLEIEAKVSSNYKKFHIISYNCYSKSFSYAFMNKKFEQVIQKYKEFNNLKYKEIEIPDNVWHTIFTTNGKLNYLSNPNYLFKNLTKLEQELFAIRIDEQLNKQ